MVVKDLLKHHSRPNSKLEMIEKIQSVWDTISIEWLRTLISTMPYRMQAVITTRDGRYYVTKSSLDVYFHNFIMQTCYTMKLDSTIFAMHFTAQKCVHF